jgi:hypothetical protein
MKTSKWFDSVLVKVWFYLQKEKTINYVVCHLTIGIGLSKISGGALTLAMPNLGLMYRIVICASPSQYHNSRKWFQTNLFVRWFS